MATEFNNTYAAFYSHGQREISFNMYFSVLRVLAFVSSLTNAVVFASPSMIKNSIYRYLFLMSVVDLIYSSCLIILTPLSFLARPDFHQRCNYTICWIYLVARLVLSEYLTSCLAIYNILLECFLTIQRIFLLSTQRSRVENSLLKSGSTAVPICIFFLIFSLVIYIPAFFLLEIVVEDHQAHTYRLVKTPFNQTWPAVLILNFLAMFRIFLVTVVLCALNIIAIVKFKQYFHKKRLLKENGEHKQLNKKLTETRHREDLANKNVTRMLIVVSFLYIFGNLPYSVAYLVKMTSVNHYKPIMLWSSQTTLNLLITFKLIVYYSFNPIYRRQVNSFAKAVPSCLYCRRTTTQEINNQS